MSITQLGNATLRRAIWDNAVSFPAQVPVFPKQSRADVQWRIVHLYFIHGWTEARIGRRFGRSRTRIGQIIAAWRMRAVTLGYIQEIKAERVSAFAVAQGGEDKAVIPGLDSAAGVTSAESSSDPAARDANRRRIGIRVRNPPSPIGNQAARMTASARSRNEPESSPLHRAGVCGVIVTGGWVDHRCGATAHSDGNAGTEPITNRGSTDAP